MKPKKLNQVTDFDIKLLKILKRFATVTALHLPKVFWVLAALQLVCI